MVFCDISKAFDRVWHKGLLFKLRQYGISGNILKWLSYYLSNRTQRVFVHTTFSNEISIKAGVPQGSVLGPLLFLVYVNDISDNLLSNLRLFADDSSLSVTSNDHAFMESILNNDLTQINTWAKQWLVSFNPSKTEVVFFSVLDLLKPQLQFDGNQLGFVETHKHLGLLFSQNGTWHNHINAILSRASKI